MMVYAQDVRKGYIMKPRSLWNRGIAALTSLLVLVPTLLTPLGGTVLAEDYDTTPLVAHFSAMERTYHSQTDGEKILRSDWQYADGASAEQGIDISHHDLNKLSIRMTVELALEEGVTLPDDIDKNQLFRGGFIKLRSMDRANVSGDPEAGNGNVEHNIGFSVRPLRLRMGRNTVSMNLAQWVANNNINTKGVFDTTTLNRMNFYIDTVDKNYGFTMTLSNVYLVDTTQTDVATTAPRVATSSEGMSSMDTIVYAVDATELGADKTGQMDSTLAIQDSINKLPNGGVVFLPAGRYKVGGTLNLPSAVTLRGEWVDPDEGGIGKGTILMAYAGKNETDPTALPFISMSSGACLRDISVWYPEQDAEKPVAYPATIYGQGHTDIINVTLYNSYYGLYNNSCSSMLVRQMHGTVLNRGIHGAYAYDIPRIENVSFDTRYWAESGLAGAPNEQQLETLNTYVENNLVAIQAGEQDWGYWYDLNINHAKYALLLTAVPDDPGNKVVPGNIAAGKLIARNVQIGVYMENVGYPGFQLTYSDIEAKQYGMYYAPKPDYSAYEQKGMRVDYYPNATIVVSTTSFKGGKAGFWSDKTSGRYGINFNDCTFAEWSDTAIYMGAGYLTCSNGTFSKREKPITLGDNAGQAILLGNSFAGEWSSDDNRITRDDQNGEITHTPDYDYTYVSDVKPVTDKIFNVLDYGAAVGAVDRLPDQDSTGAIQNALNAAGAAGGGTVYLPAGVYRVNGALTVPTGVELRGTFESAHYGNSTERGTQIFAYGNKDNANGAPLITLAEGAGVKGFSVAYPEQGYTDKEGYNDNETVHAYPPTVRANKNTWIQNMTMIATYTAIDAMTNRCDNIVITDVTGAAMYATLEMGHGTDGGYVQNLHFNYSGWVQQWRYPNRPGGDISSDGVTSTNDLMEDYTTRVVKGLILGDVKNVNFFSCFNIIVAEQIVLKSDPYTGGDFDGVMWGVAFDAATNGVVGTAGSKANLAIVSSMGVFKEQQGGYNVKTLPGFEGRVSLYNADAWDARSNLVYVEGGTVDLVQYFSWCVYKGVVKQGGTLNVLASTIISNNNNDNGYVPNFTYEAGSFGKVIGNLECRDRLNINIWPNADVIKAYNGPELSAKETLMNFSALATTKEADNSQLADGQKGSIVETGWQLVDGGSADRGVNLSGYNADTLRLQLTVTLTKEGATEPDENLYRAGRLQLRSVDADGREQWNYWSMEQLGLHTGENVLSLKLSDAQPGTAAGQNALALNLRSVNRVRIYIDSLNNYKGKFTMTTSAARIVDLTALNRQKLALKKALDTVLDPAGHTDAEMQQYQSLRQKAEELYNSETATVAQVDQAATELQRLLDQLQPDGALVVLGRFTKAEGSYKVTSPAQGAVNTGWKTADKTIDLSAYDRNKLYLRMTVTLEKDNQAADDQVFSTGKIKLGSTKVKGENTYDIKANLPNLYSGANYIMLPLSNAEKNGDLSWANVSRLQMYIDSLNKAAGTYTMTLSDVCIVGDVLPELQMQLKQALLRAVDESRYTPQSYSAYQTAKAAAQAVSDNKQSLATEVLEALESLNAAYAALTEHADTTALAAALKTEQDSPVDGNRYTAVSYEAYKTALDEATALLADGNASQTMVDTAIKALQTAKKGLKKLVHGDVTQTGKVDVMDALMTLQHAAGRITLDGRQQYMADVDGSGSVTAADALVILQYANGQRTSFPAKD